MGRVKYVKKIVVLVRILQRKKPIEWKDGWTDGWRGREIDRYIDI